MTNDTLKMANDLKERISRLDTFISIAENDPILGIIKEPLEKAEKLTLCSSRYPLPHIYYEVSKELKQKIVKILYNEKAELQKELDNL